MKIFQNHLFTVCLILFGFIWITSVAHAQIPNLENASIQLLPSAPNPLQQVSAELKSFSADTERSTITWTINGTVVAKGVGATRINFQTGPIGSVTTLQVDIDDPFGKHLSVERVVRPAHVGIAWEADTYTPPFYRGKALLSPGAAIQFTAIPIIIDASGNSIGADKLLYTWIENNREMREVSGLGRQTLVMNNDTYLRPLNIAVEVSTFDGSVKAKGSVTVPITQPQVYFYEFHPLLGVRYAHALSGTVPLAGAEMSVIAEPFFYSSASRSDTSLEYAWTVDRTPIDASGMITLRPEGSEGGRSSVQLILRHVAQIMQSTRDTFTISFTAPTQTGPLSF